MRYALQFDHAYPIAVCDLRTVAPREAGDALDDAIRHFSVGEERPAATNPSKWA